MEPKDWLTLALAAYGAVVSTTALRHTLRKDVRDLRIEQSTGFFTFGAVLGPPMATFNVINSGHRPVELRSFALLLPDGQQIVWPQPFPHSTPLPHRLVDGDAATIYVPFRELADSLEGRKYRGKVRLRPAVRDATGRQYVGKTWKFRPSEWRNEPRMT